MSTVRTVAEVWNEGKNEVKDSSIPKKLTLGAAACGLAFDWSLGNESLLSYVGGNVLKNTQDTLLTAAATGGTSFVEQSAIGLVTVASINNFPRFMDTLKTKIDERHNSNSDDVESFQDNKSKLSRGTDRFMVAFLFGTSMSALKNNAVKKHTPKENVKNVAIDAGLIGGGVAGIAAVAAGATNIGRSTGLQQETDLFVNIISNPFTYLTIFGGKFGLDRLRSKRAVRKAAKSKKPN